MMAARHRTNGLRRPRVLLCSTLLVLSLHAVAAGQVPNDDPALEVRMYDRVELTNGQVLEGEVLEETGTGIQFRQKNGIASRLSSSDIRSILRKNPPEKVYATRVKNYFDPGSFEDQVALARWCLEAEIGLVVRGIGHYERATTLDPSAPDVYQALLPLYRARPASQRTTEEHDRELATCLRGISAGASTPDLRLRAAELLVGLADARGAVLILEPLAERTAEDTTTQFSQDLLVQLLDGLGRRAEARPLVARWTEERSGSAALPLERLRSKWLLEDVAAGVPGAAEKLRDSLDAIVAEAPEDGSAHLRRGCLRMLEGRPAEAATAFQRAFELGEVGAEAALTYALNFARRGELDQALELIAMARSAAGVADLVPLVEAYVKENQGDSTIALELLEEVAMLGDGATWQGAVIAIQGRDRLDDGFGLEGEVDRALDRFGENPAAFAELSVLLGDAALRDGRADVARRWLGYARAAGRALPEVLLRIGLAQLGDGGDATLAAEALAAAVEAAPGDADIHNALGCLDYRAGRLEAARTRFERVLALVPAPQTTDVPVPPARDYALAALESIDRALGEEVWSDDFEREDGPQILNNWEKKETFGISIELRDGAVRFAGTQAFQPEGLTKLHRGVEGSNLARVRAHLRIPSSANPARIGLRLARAEGQEEGAGIVVFRDLDGTLAIALNGRDEASVVRTDATGEDTGDLWLEPTVWPDDGEGHWLEFRMPLDPREGSASVLLDGVPIIRGIPAPRLTGRTPALVGVSGQADLDRNYRFELLDFEIFRRRPASSGGSSNR